MCIYMCKSKKNGNKTENIEKHWKTRESQEKNLMQKKVDVITFRF